MAKSLEILVQFEIDQIEQLLATYAPLRDAVQYTQPDVVQITAIAAMLHSFYNGVEHMFTIIAKQVDGELPAGTQWHRTLLDQMSRPTATRLAVISPLLMQHLSPYLAFRHFFRHAYSFLLSWNKIEHLLPPLLAVWADTKHETLAFIDNTEIS